MKTRLVRIFTVLCMLAGMVVNAIPVHAAGYTVTFDMHDGNPVAISTDADGILKVSRTDHPELYNFQQSTWPGPVESWCAHDSGFDFYMTLSDLEDGIGVDRDMTVNPYRSNVYTFWSDESKTTQLDQRTSNIYGSLESGNIPANPTEPGKTFVDWYCLVGPNADEKFYAHGFDHSGWDNPHDFFPEYIVSQIDISPASVTFPTMKEGYAEPNSLAVTVTNISSGAITLEATGGISPFYLKSTDPSSNPYDAFTLEPNGSKTLQVGVRAGMAAGTYNKTLHFQDASTHSVIGTVSISAVIEPNTDLVNLTFHYDGGIMHGIPAAMNLMQEYTVKVDSKRNCGLYVAVEKDRLFTGWAKQPNAAVPDYTPPQLAAETITASTELWPVWSDDGYVVTYDANGGGVYFGDFVSQTRVTSLQTTVAKGQSLGSRWGSPQEGSKGEAAGYSLTQSGEELICPMSMWSGGSGQKPFPFVPTGNVTIYAAYGTYHAVTLVNDSSETADETVYVRSGAALNVANHTPAKTGYTFDKYEFADGSAYTGQPITSDTTLRAVYSGQEAPADDVVTEPVISGADVAPEIAEAIRNAAVVEAAKLAIASTEAEKILADVNMSAVGADEKVILQTYLDIKIKTKSADALIIDITPMYRVVQMKKTSDDRTLPGTDGATQVKTGKRDDLVNSTAGIPMSIPVKGFADGYSTVYVTHTKENGKVYVYTASVDSNGNAAFTNTHGFSEFKVGLTDPAVARTAGVGYMSLQDATDNVENNGTITVISKSAVSATVSREITFTLVNGDKAMINAGDGYTLIKNGNTYIIRKAESSSEDSSESVPVDNVVTCQMAGYPANFAWNESAKACQPGYLDDNGIFHPARNASGKSPVPATADSGFSIWAFLVSMVRRVF